MSEERRKVLEMLAAGKISAEQAEKLLDKLAGGGANQSNAGEAQAASTPSGASKPKYLRIVVDSPGRDPVNVRVPISLAGSARRLLAVMPLQVSERLAEHGIDAGFFSGAKGENLDEMMRELNIDVEEGKGKKVRIFCE
jgi:hypothetical protein